MKDEVAVLYTTWPDAESAAAAGRMVIEERLCACVNVLGPMRSVYRWKDGIEDAVETPALFKTTSAGANALRERLMALHPYEIPCILMVRTEKDGSSPAYTEWIGDSVGPMET